MPKRNRSTFGSITKMRNGVWRLRYPDDTPNGRKRVSETVYGTRRDAEDRLAEIRLHRSPRGGAPTLSYVYDNIYLPYLEALLAMDKVKPATFRQYKGVYESHIRDALGNIPVTKLTAVTIQQYLLSVKKSIGATSRIVIREVMQQALMAEYVSTNVASTKFVLSSSGEKRSKDIYTLSQLTRLDKLLHGHIIEAAYLMQAHAGLRVGESLAVSTNSISFVDSIDGGRVAVIEVSHTTTTAGTIAPTKTRTIRNAYMTEPWSRRLEALVHTAMDNGNTYLCGFDSNPLSLKECERLWNRVDMPVDLPRIPMRNLRNSYETYMHWELGQSIEVTSKLLGHSQVATTAKHYDRPDDSVLLHAAENSVSALPKTLRIGTHRDTASL